VSLLSWDPLDRVQPGASIAVRAMTREAVGGGV
jgi:hypothetical protein